MAKIHFLKGIINILLHFFKGIIVNYYTFSRE